MQRRSSKQVMAGGVAIGGGAPITVQSMLNVPPQTSRAAWSKPCAWSGQGAKILRAAIPNKEAVALIPAIKERVSIPLVADIHFDYKLALELSPPGRTRCASTRGTSGARTG